MKMHLLAGQERLGHILKSTEAQRTQLQIN